VTRDVTENGDGSIFGNASLVNPATVNGNIAEFGNGDIILTGLTVNGNIAGHLPGVVTLTGVTVSGTVSNT
jgi:hypothetical protein